MFSISKEILSNRQEKKSPQFITVKTLNIHNKEHILKSAKKKKRMKKRKKKREKINEEKERKTHIKETHQSNKGFLKTLKGRRD